MVLRVVFCVVAVTVFSQMDQGFGCLRRRCCGRRFPRPPPPLPAPGSLLPAAAPIAPLAPPVDPVGADPLFGAGLPLPPVPVADPSILGVGGAAFPLKSRNNSKVDVVEEVIPADYPFGAVEEKLVEMWPVWEEACQAIQCNFQQSPIEWYMGSKVGPKQTAAVQSAPFSIIQDLRVSFSFYESANDVNLKVCFDDSDNCKEVSEFGVRASHRRWRLGDIVVPRGQNRVLYFVSENIGIQRAAVGIADLKLYVEQGRIDCRETETVKEGLTSSEVFI